MYKNPEGIDEFFDYLSELEENRTDKENPLYCKIIEWHRDSFIYLPAVLVTINTETKKEIENKIRELKFTASVQVEQVEGEELFSYTLFDIKAGDKESPWCELENWIKSTP